MYMSEKPTYSELWKQGIIERLYQRFSEVVKTFELPLLDIIVQKSLEIFEGRDELSMFEIGAGTGKYTGVILRGIAPGHHISYTGIDISPAQQKKFEENRAKFPETVGVEGYTLSSWHDYQVTKPYDLVLAQHSWYGIGGATENFEKIKKILANDGVCFIMLNPKGNLSQIAMEHAGEKPFSSEDLEIGLTMSGLPFEKIRSYNDDNPRESFLHDGRLTQRGLDHFSYLYRKDLRGDEKDIIEMIESTPDDAFRFPTDLIIVRKNIEMPAEVVSVA